MSHRQLDPDTTPAELEALGLYDPAAPDAAERLTMLCLAIETGATVEEMRAGIAEDRLHAIPAERVLEGGAERLTLDEAIARSGIEPALGRRVWRAFGFVEPAPDVPACTERDVDLFAIYQLLVDAFGEDAAMSLVRTMGSTMARLADSEISAARSFIEAPIRSEGGTSADIAKTFVEVARSTAEAMYPMMETVLRHHLVSAGRRYSAWGVAPSVRQTSDAVVGFADIVGYTSQTQHLAPDELEALIQGFEDRALAATARPGARLVKTIGDEAMYVAGSVHDAVEIARGLIHDPKLPPLRVGLAAGEIVTRDGDVFGQVVNLAARLVAVAEPEQIVCDVECVRRYEGDGGLVTSLGTRSIQGFDTPVAVHAIAT